MAERKQRDPGKPRRPAPERPRVAAASAARDGGFLTVNADPYATVYVDGKKHGFTPVVRLALPPGSHRLRLVSSTGQPDKKMRVQVAPGQELRKFIKW
jgi:eukaryotic-like serine/threonine-protein kinase